MRHVYRSLLVIVAGVLATGGAAGAAAPEANRAPVSVIVREAPGAGDAPERAVSTAGGRIVRRLGIINGFEAAVPARSLERLRGIDGVQTITRNRRVRLSNDLDGWDHTHDLGSMYYVAQEVTGAAEYWNDGFTGKGVDVALIDSGVAPVNGLRTAGKVVNGADLSFDSRAPNLRYLDGYGHGTHLAGIIAGRDDATPARVQKGEESFVGIAPDARIVNVKVADAHGATDVSQVIAAIDWVVEHRRDNGMNIRVLNLSFGTDGEQDYRVDPLAFAAEVAWRKGIVVVVAAGNGGFGSEKLNNPAYDPFVIAVGGADGRGTYDWADDIVPEWSSFGDGTRNPDLVAPGRSVVGLRVPGSFIDQQHPAGRVGSTPRFFRGSGTSQAAATVSGAAALVLQQRPNLTPDGVKAILVKSAQKLWQANVRGQGAGMLNLKIARDLKTRSLVNPQGWAQSTGTGSLDLARGSMRVALNDVVLQAEQDVFGNTWNGQKWAADAANEASWDGGSWNGNAWSGNAWSGTSWAGNAWSSLPAGSLTGNAWSGNAWSGNAWSGNAWSGNAWSGSSWG